MFKEWEKLPTDENSDSPEKFQRYKELVCAREKFMKGRHENLKLLWKHELDAVEYRLQESEEQGSHSEPLRIMIPSELLPTQNVHERMQPHQSP